MAISHRKIGIIGAGRLGSALAFASFPNGDVVAASSRSAQRRKWMEKLIPNLTATSDPSEVARLADLVFITTSDEAIRHVCENIDWLPSHHVVHCSGVLSLDILESAKNAGALVAGFHPLQTFPDYGNSYRLWEISIAIDSEFSDLSEWLTDLVHAFKSEPFPIQGETAHAAYHASAVLACGLLAGLVGISAELWQSADIDRPRALKLLSPILKSTIEAITEDGIPDAISGPYVRGDIQTIKTHLETTNNINPDISRAYAALALAQLPIANEKGNLDQSTLDQIRKTLTDHLEAL